MATRRLRLSAYALTLAVALLALGPLATGVPFVSYASSGSMSPTIDRLDVFFVNPFAKRIELGDVIVFESVKRGMPSVHRVVDGDEAGWYTQGDANPNLDQLAGEPPVTRDRVLGRVVSWPGGEPVVLRGLGIPLVQLQVERAKLAESVGGEKVLDTYTLVALSLLAGLLAMRRGSAIRSPLAPEGAGMRRWLRRHLPHGVLGRHVASALLVTMLLASAHAASRAATEVEVAVVVVKDPRVADGVKAVAPGGVASREAEVGSLGFLPTMVVVEPGTANVRVPVPVQGIGSWASTTVAYEIQAGGSHGVQREQVVVWRYPAVLPDAWTESLHDRAPGSPYFAVAALLGLAGSAWFRLLGLTNLPVGRWLGMREEWL